jgi:hypothetical protein
MLLIFCFFILIVSCKKTQVIVDTQPQPESYYFPPITGDVWETKSIASAGWDSLKLTEAFDYA